MEISRLVQPFLEKVRLNVIPKTVEGVKQNQVTRNDYTKFGEQKEHSDNTDKFEAHRMITQAISFSTKLTHPNLI